MAIQRLRVLWDGFLTAKSKVVVPDYRKVQKEIDISRLFLLTSYRRLDSSATDEDLDRIEQLGRTVPFPDQEHQVQENIHDQVRNISRALDTIFLAGCERKKSLEEGFKRPSGLAFAVTKSKPDIEVQKLLGPPATASLGKYDIDEALKNQLGFSLHLKDSEVPGHNAGQGLFLEGIARTGTVVALYPGVIYSPAKYWYIPGYPKLDNPYLVSRYEGYVIDGKSWGKGGTSREFWDGYDEPEEKEEDLEDRKEEQGEEAMVDKASEGEAASQGGKEKKIGDRFKALIEVKDEDDTPPPSRLKIEVIERRNPLALAHFVNHPPKGQLPNVMICPYDFPEHEEDMRPYIPNLRFEDDTVKNMERRGKSWSKVPLPEVLSAKDRDPTYLRGLVLVTTRNVCNEELLLNYRLSNPKTKPEWYHPVDEAEERRRWANQDGSAV
ncbi:uncharacterized protein LOC9658478 [Selaginella moellendorffii]|uniref:uncharacterized protein LOC9658478 n=1 Tax=Selaginella moellendorffii TaxID=88036 RepID=UPI000D1CA0CD|nr:uncharacterized protein LOC9658478 [Selaginella moellendorffii]|eukprot:XP_024525451.1 uncharacterized protein LOC9658478 [Selaginella moellendorffii]